MNKKNKKKGQPNSGGFWQASCCPSPYDLNAPRSTHEIYQLTNQKALFIDEWPLFHLKKNKKKDQIKELNPRLSVSIPLDKPCWSYAQLLEVSGVLDVIGIKWSGKITPHSFVIWTANVKRKNKLLKFTT